MQVKVILKFEDDSTRLANNLIISMSEICYQEKCSYQIIIIIFYLVHIHHTFIPDKKCVIRGTVRLGNICLGNCPFQDSRNYPLENYPPGNFPSGKCLWEMSTGEISVGEFYGYLPNSPILWKAPFTYPTPFFKFCLSQPSTIFPRPRWPHPHSVFYQSVTYSWEIL